MWYHSRLYKLLHYIFAKITFRPKKSYGFNFSNKVKTFKKPKYIFKMQFSDSNRLKKVVIYLQDFYIAVADMI